MVSKLASPWFTPSSITSWMKNGMTSAVTCTMSDRIRTCARAERRLTRLLHKSDSRVLAWALIGLKSAVGVNSSATPVK